MAGALKRGARDRLSIVPTREPCERGRRCESVPGAVLGGILSLGVAGWDLRPCDSGDSGKPVPIFSISVFLNGKNNEKENNIL